VLALLLGLVLCAAAGDSSAPAPATKESELERLHREVARPVDEEDPFADGRVPDLVLLSTTDVGGDGAPAVEAITCAEAGPAGQRHRRSRTTPAVLVDAGDFTGVLPTTAGAAFPARDVEEAGYDAITIGHGDSRLGAEFLRSLAADSSAHVVSANLRDHGTGKLLCRKSRIVEKAGVKVGVTAVTIPTSKDGGELAELGIDCGDAQQALADVLPELRRRCDVTVLLARMPIEQAKQLASALPISSTSSSSVGRTKVAGSSTRRTAARCTSPRGTAARAWAACARCWTRSAGRSASWATRSCCRRASARTRRSHAWWRRSRPTSTTC
jgi:hypothetical protein